MHRFFFLFFSLSRKIAFTETIGILGGIHRFSDSNKAFSQKQNADSESNEVSFEFISQRIVKGLQFLYMCHKMTVVK